MASQTSAQRPPPDDVLVQIADYAASAAIDSAEAYDTARLVLMDSIGCMMLALDFPQCVKMLGPVVPGAVLPGGARVPGTSFELDPVQAAFNIGTLVRWLDYNDTWLAAEWGHPSDNLGAILAVADWMDRGVVDCGLRIADCGLNTGDASANPQSEIRNPQSSSPQRHFTVRSLLTWMIKAHEIQGVLALENAFNRVGLDHVILVRIASTAVATAMMGGTREQIWRAVSNAWVDGGALRTYRHAPNTGPRKSWAAGDATSRAVRHALWAMDGQEGYPSALTARTWGFYDVLFKGNRFALPRPLGSYVMEHVLFKVSYPAEFHAQTAVECALKLHPLVLDRLDQVDRIVLETQEPAIRIIDKTGPLANYADRDHCLQYMVAVPLIVGDLKADHYSDAFAQAEPRIDALRAKMQVVENTRYSADYLDPEQRSIGNAVQVFFADGTATERVEVEYPVGHRRRRAEAVPLLRRKFKDAASPRLGGERTDALLERFANASQLDALRLRELIAQLVVPN